MRMVGGPFRALLPIFPPILARKVLSSKPKARHLVEYTRTQSTQKWAKIVHNSSASLIRLLYRSMVYADAWC